MMRRWPCGCVPCREQSEKLTFAERFALNPRCERAAIFGTLNDWKKVRLLPTADGEDDDDNDDDDGYLALANATEQNTAQIQPGDYGAFETADDSTLPAAAKLKGIGFYCVQFSSEPYSLQESTDLSAERFEMVRKLELKPGEPVIDAEYLNPVWGPNAKRQWYTPMEGQQRHVVVPARAVVHASFAMRRATANDGAKDARAKAALAKCAVVLEAGDREIIMEELRTRDLAG